MTIKNLLFTLLIFLLLLSGCGFDEGKTESEVIDPQNPADFPVPPKNSGQILEHNTSFPEVNIEEEINDNNSISKAPSRAPYYSVRVLREESYNSNMQLSATQNFVYGGYWNGSYDSSIIIRTEKHDGTKLEYMYDSNGRISVVNTYDMVGNFNYQHTYYRDSHGRMTYRLHYVVTQNHYLLRAIIYNDKGTSEIYDDDSEQILYDYRNSSWIPIQHYYTYRSGDLKTITTYMYNINNGDYIYAGAAQFSGGGYMQYPTQEILYNSNNQPSLAYTYYSDANAKTFIMDTWTFYNNSWNFAGKSLYHYDDTNQGNWRPVDYQRSTQFEYYTIY